VLRLLAQGRTDREIAAQLRLSTATIRVHVAKILTKLAVSDRTQAAVRAIQLGCLAKTKRCGEAIACLPPTG
jgi:DNA-binding NarL/FixJ family response regulator